MKFSKRVEMLKNLAINEIYDFLGGDGFVDFKRPFRAYLFSGDEPITVVITSVERDHDDIWLYYSTTDRVEIQEFDIDTVAHVLDSLYDG